MQSLIYGQPPSVSHHLCLALVATTITTPSSAAAGKPPTECTASDDRIMGGRTGPASNPKFTFGVYWTKEKGCGIYLYLNVDRVPTGYRHHYLIGYDTERPTRESRARYARKSISCTGDGQRSLMLTITAGPGRPSSRSSTSSPAKCSALTPSSTTSPAATGATTLTA